MPNVDVTLAATETNGDSISIVINVYTPETSAVSQAGAKVSIEEVDPTAAILSIRIPDQ